MADGNLLSDIDVTILRDVIDEFTKAKGGEPRYRLPPVVDHLTPEVYLALTPPGGIAPLSLGADTATGTGHVSDDVPGQADCYIYRVVPGTSATTQRIGDLTQTVYNFNTIAIGGGMWVTIQRDKFGQWLIPCSGFSFSSC